MNNINTSPFYICIIRFKSTLAVAELVYNKKWTLNTEHRIWNSSLFIKKMWATRGASDSAFDVGCWTFDVRCWSFITFESYYFVRQTVKTTPYFEVMNRKKYDLEDRLLGYSSRIITIVEQIPKSRTGSHISNQLLKSGTSPYSNHGEAQAAESSNDFIHKLRICLKELRETQRWLKLIQHIKIMRKHELVNAMLAETEELIKIFVTSIKTAEKNRP